MGGRLTGGGRAVLMLISAGEKSIRFSSMRRLIAASDSARQPGVRTQREGEEGRERSISIAGTETGAALAACHPRRQPPQSIRRCQPAAESGESRIDRFTKQLRVYQITASQIHYSKQSVLEKVTSCTGAAV